MAVPFKIDLSGKVAVVTGGGGILCSVMSEAIAECGAKVAVLDLRKDAADKVAERINAAGGTAIGIACNVLDKASIEAAAAEVEAKLGKIDILLNGAGGNNPKGTTDNETMTMADVQNTVFVSLGANLAGFFVEGLLCPAHRAQPPNRSSLMKIPRYCTAGSFCTNVDGST